MPVTAAALVDEGDDQLDHFVDKLNDQLHDCTVCLFRHGAPLPRGLGADPQSRCVDRHQDGAYSVSVNFKE